MNRTSPSTLRIPGTIARDLGVKIVSGKLKPGTVLDGEIAASDQLQVSRSAYREAVRILVAKGLVRSRPKTGTRVNDRATWHLLDPDVLSWIFQVEPDKGLLLNLFELRKIVEPEAAALAARRRLPRHLKLMAAALEGMAHHTLVKKEGQDADQDFHAALLEASGNLVLGSLTSSINSAVAWSTIFKQRFEPLKRDPVPDHRKVYDAIAAGAPSAARKAMAELVDLAYFDITNAPKWPGDRSAAGKKKRLDSRNKTSKNETSKKKSPGKRRAIKR
jgi:DNA-binding FadR family transcriptional regulator